MVPDDPDMYVTAPRYGKMGGKGNEVMGEVEEEGVDQICHRMVCYMELTSSSLLGKEIPSIVRI